MSARMEKVKQSWETVPDWIVELVRLCDAEGSSQSKIAQSLGYSAGLISSVLSNSYAGDMAGIERRFRDHYLSGNVDCPSNGTISSRECLAWRDRAKQLSSASPLIVRMFRSCRACPRYIGETDE